MYQTCLNINCHARFMWLRQAQTRLLGDKAQHFVIYKKVLTNL